MSCAALRPNEQVLSGPGFGPCIASHLTARRVACSSLHETTWPPENSRQSTAYRASLLGWTYQSFQSQWSKAKLPHTSQATPTKVIALLAAIIAAPAYAEGFVLSMRVDGQLETKAPQSGFAQSYIDGVGENAPELLVFAAPEPQAPRTSPPPAIPRPETLAALESTAHRYGGHPWSAQSGVLAPLF